ncbi:N-acetylmuramoyl-L-alanine amidase [Capnocytophaga sp. oral taxon 338 str. F0234]|nr:N-acetylmuramoyl-L-alanine amidase [Capnocytophaga sp. oral taxon 338 str. F0234]
MKHLLILFLLLTTNAFAQGPFGDYAVVKDKDGYVNIRAKESVKSKIVGTLPNNTLVYTLFDTTYDESGEEISFNWLYVDKGYVHKSRLKKVQDFPSAGLKNKIIALPLQGKVLACPLTKQPFDKTKHKITKKRHKEYNELIIDGKRVQGRNNDEFLPLDHYKSITVIIDSKDVPIPKNAYDDLYEIGLYMDNNFVYYDKEDDILYIISYNGDGANAYQVMLANSKRRI